MGQYFLNTFYISNVLSSKVVQHYTLAVGRSSLPPYWSLGFHLSRHGYNSLANMMAARERMLAYNLPQDSQWADIDVMDRHLDFTIDNNKFGSLPMFVKDLKKNGVRFVPILDPGISINQTDCTYKPFDLGQTMGVWVNRPDGSPVQGQVWPHGPVYYPDFTNQRTHEWWKLLIADYHKVLPFDGLWLDMNEPSNFGSGDLRYGCGNSNINFPPYIPHVKINNATHGLGRCIRAKHSVIVFHNLHLNHNYFVIFKIIQKITVFVP